MYTPRHFDVPDPEEAMSLLRGIGLGVLVTTGDGGFQATPMPFVPSADGRTLRGHVAKANGQWQALGGDGIPALVILQGANAYVSPDWYETPLSVPTWNYEAVHVTGRARAVQDAEWLTAMLADLSAIHEAGREKPWTLDKLTPDHLARQLKGIVGIEVTVERIQAKRKLSQNKNAADRAGVIAGLEAEGGTAGAEVARLMRALFARETTQS